MARGCIVAFPAEQAVYYSAGNLGPRLPYDAHDIDYFFIVDGGYHMYLIPSRVIAGRMGIMLRTYKKYIVGNAGGLLGVGLEAAGRPERASA